MPSLSKAQHGFMGLVKQFKLTHDMPHGLTKQRRAEIRAAAAKMSHEQLDDYLGTKTDKLPGHVGEQA